MRAHTASRFAVSFLSLFAALLLTAWPAQAAVPVAKLTVVRPVVAGQSVSARLQATDAEGNALTFEIVSPPVNGMVTLTNAATGDFTYVTAADATLRSRDSFTFRVRDAEGSSAVQTAFVTVLPPPGNLAVVPVSTYNPCGSLDVQGWTNVVQVAAGDSYSVGLKADGTVVAAGCNSYGETNVSGWRNIVQVAAGLGCTVGVKADGTVLLTGYNVGDVSGWRNIVAVATAGYNIVGLKADGTVVYAGRSNYGENQSAGWSNVIALAASQPRVVGLRADGTVVAAGYAADHANDTGGWSNIVAIGAGHSHTVGLKADGTAVAAGYAGYKQVQVDTWRDLTAIGAAYNYTIGIKSDGSHVAAGGDYYGVYDLGPWKQVQGFSTGMYHSLWLISTPAAASVTLYTEPGAAVQTGNLLQQSLSAPGQPASINGFTQGAAGTVTDNGDGGFTYTPNTGFSGADTFTYTLTDGSRSSIGTVIVNVSADWDGDGVANAQDAFPLNAAEWLDTDHDGVGNNTDWDDDNDGIDDWNDPAPLNARPTNHMLNTRPVVAGQILNSVLPGSDAEGDPLTFEIVAQPSQGQLMLNTSTGEFSYQTLPNGPWLRRDSFSYRIHDATDVTDVKTVQLTVLPRGPFSAQNVGWMGQLFYGSEIVALSSGPFYVLGLQADGRVLVEGMTLPEVPLWSDIVAVAAGESFAAGLMSDGTVVVDGDPVVKAATATWQNVVALAASRYHLVGLKADGTVVAAANSDMGQLDVGAWTDIVAVTAGDYFTVAVKADGTVVACGDFAVFDGTRAWTDIVAVSGGSRHVVGLKRNGTVVTAGFAFPNGENIPYWRDIVAVSAGFDSAIGIKANGTVVVAGDTSFGLGNVGALTGVWSLDAAHGGPVMLKSETVIAANLQLYAEPVQPTGVTTPDVRALSYVPQGVVAFIGGVEPAAHGYVETDYVNSTMTYYPNPGYKGNDQFIYHLVGAPGQEASGIVKVLVSDDWDNDGTPNASDDLPLDPADFMDTDHDGIGNSVDTDDDNDGIPDDVDPAPLNARPVALMLNVRPIVAGDSVSATLRAYDPENDPRTFQIVQMPQRGVITAFEPATGAFTYASYPGVAGPDSFTFQVSDATGYPTQQTVHFTTRERGDTVVATGRSDTLALEVGGWRDVIAVAAGANHTVGLLADGTVVTAGLGSDHYDTSAWSNIVAIAAGGMRTVGLRSDGSVVATGDEMGGGNQVGASQVGGWRDIAAVAAGNNHTVGLKSDGTVVAVGDNTFGQLNVDWWRNIVAVAARGDRTIGLTSDGYVLMAGTPMIVDFNGWNNIAAVSLGMTNIVAQRADGTLMATGDNYAGQGNVSGWDGIIGFAAGGYHTLGVRMDGTVLATGSNDIGELNVGAWRDIVAVAAGMAHSVGLQRPRATVPAFNWPSGAYESGLSLEITALPADAIIFYTLDGSEPTFTSPIYNGPVTLTEGAYVVKAFAAKPGYVPSPIVTANYTIYPPVGLNLGPDNTFTAVGGSGAYAITVNPNANGATGTLVDNGNGSYTFVPPTTGAFAGDYTIDVRDPGTGAVHHFSLSVPLRVTTDRPRILSNDELRNDTEVQVRGAGAGARVTLGLDEDASRSGLAVFGTPGIAEDNPADGNPARFVVLAPNNLPASLTAGITAGVPGASGSGSLEVVASMPYRGQLFNAIAQPVSGATVTLLSSRNGQPALPWEDDLGRVTATSGSDGSFTLYAPPLADQEVHSLQVTALTYATAVEPAANCTAAPCTVTLSWESNAAAPLFTPAAGTYEQGVLVTMESSTVDALLRYTTDGTAPTRTSGIEVANGTGVQLSRGTTLKAVAYKDGLGVSTETDASYVIVSANAASGLVATVVGAAEIDLAWNDNSAKENGFRVYRATGSGGFEAVALTGANVTSYKDTGLAANTSYRYYVVAWVSGAESEASNIVTASTAADTVAPTISSVVPAGNATAVPLNRTVTVNFSEPVDCATITSATFTLKNASGVAVAATLGCSGATATLTPSALLTASRTYTANVTRGVKDGAGNVLAAAKSWKFTTGSTKDAVAPKVTATTPAANAANVPVTQVISATFSENLDCASVTSTSVVLATGGTPVAGSLSCSGKIVTLDPVALLPANRALTLTFTTAIRDQARNALGASYGVNFTTAP